MAVLNPWTGIAAVVSVVAKQLTLLPAHFPDHVKAVSERQIRLRRLQRMISLAPTTRREAPEVLSQVAAL